MSQRKRRTAVKISGKDRGRKPSATPTKKSPIAWQNKDITAKYFGEHLKGKSFAVYGLKLPKITEVQPTNLPAVEANELRLDNLFLLEDNSLALVDYESTYADSNKIKYLNYIVRTLKRNMEQFQLEEAFLTQKDSEKTEARLYAKFHGNQALTKEEQMEFIILPLTYKGTTKKQACIRRCFEMAKLLDDEDLQHFLLSGMLVFADKVITTEDSKQIKEWIMMTKVGLLFEEEKIQYGREIEKRVTKDVTKKVTAKVTKNVTKNVTQHVTRNKELEFTKKMLHAGLSVKEVSGMMTVLTTQDVEKIAEKMDLVPNDSVH